MAAEPGRQPAGPAPLVGDHADPVPGVGVGAGRRARAAQREVQGRRAGFAYVRGRVDEEHHVLRALGGEGVHLQPAAPGAGRPVDTALPVTRHVLAHPGELDALPGDPGRVLAEPVRQPPEHDPGPLLRRGRVAVEAGQRRARVPLGQPPAVPQRHLQRADLPPPPAFRGNHQTRPRPVGRRGADRGDLEPGVQPPAHRALARALPGDVHRHVHGQPLALEDPPGARLRQHGDARRPPVHPPGHQQQQRRRRQARELRAPGQDGDEQPGQPEREQPPGVPRRPPVQLELGASGG